MIAMTSMTTSFVFTDAIAGPDGSGPFKVVTKGSEALIAITALCVNEELAGFAHRGKLNSRQVR